MKAENSKIAKNTLFMYMRMGVSMIISLYTSRLILQYLGISDFGIYNVVGGIVVIFSFVNSAMTTSTSRFISYAIGKQDTAGVTEIFATTLFLHGLLSAIVVILSETVGLWYVNYIMKLPAERMDIVQYVFQCSVLNTVFIILTVPFSSLIVSLERMNVYAYISIVDVVMKLSIVILLSILPFDKLLVYAVLQGLLGWCILLFYAIYCKRHKLVQSYAVRPNYNKAREIVIYSGWTLYGSLAGVASSQGLNLVLNYFFGNIINAAYGITSQVQRAVTSFSSGFQIALNPQITKSYAANNMERHYELLSGSMKYSFFLISMTALPILLNTERILDLWLVNYPDHTIEFIQWLLLASIVSAISNPIGVSIEATGKIKKITVVGSTVTFLTLPVTYLAIVIYREPVITFVVSFTMSIISLIIKLYYCGKLTHLSLWSLFKCNLWIMIKVMSLSLLFCILANMWINGSDWYITLLRIAMDFILFTLAVYLYGLNKNERELINNRIVKWYKTI